MRVGKEGVRVGKEMKGNSGITRRPAENQLFDAETDGNEQPSTTHQQWTVIQSIMAFRGVDVV